MTAKRFVTNGVTIRDRGNDKTYRIMTHHSELMEFLGELNHLHEENQRLKSSNMEYEDALARFEEENEQLKKVIAEDEKLIQSTYDELKVKMY